MDHSDGQGLPIGRIFYDAWDENGQLGESDSKNTEIREADDRARSGTQRAGASTAPQPGGGESVNGCLSNTHPYSSNTHPYSSQTIPLSLTTRPECRVSGGIDWFEWSACLSWPESSLASLVGWLDSAKAECQRIRKPDVFREVPGFGTVRVCRTGMNHGGDRGQHFEYKLQVDGIHVGLANRPQGTETLPNFYTRQTGRECLLIGAREGYDLLGAFTDSLGAELQSQKLHRVDICLDIVNLDISELQEPVERRQFVSTAGVRQHLDLQSEVRTGFEVGKRPLRLIVYDKFGEQLGKTDMLYIQALFDRRWKGIQTPTATRVEYQLARPWLKGHGIESPQDLLRLIGTVATTVADERFRITDGPVDRKNKNQQRAATLPLWADIQEAFSLFFGSPSGELVPIDRSQVDPQALILQARGCLAAAMLQKGLNPNSYRDFVRSCSELLLDCERKRKDGSQFIGTLKSRKAEYLP